MEGTKVLRCNGCGKEVVSGQGVPREELLEIEWKWGYFSKKDGECHSFCLCEDCYDRIRRAFALPVTVREYL